MKLLLNSSSLATLMYANYVRVLIQNMDILTLVCIGVQIYFKNYVTEENMCTIAYSNFKYHYNFKCMTTLHIYNRVTYIPENIY